MPQDRQQPEPEAGLCEQQFIGGSRVWLRRIVVGGTTTLAVPAGSGLVWLVSGRPDVRLLLGVAAVTMVVAMILNALAVMYQARQETRRKEIERAAADALAAALARCLDDAHAKAQGLPAGRQVEEAARVRDSAAKIVADLSPAIAMLLGRRSDHPDDDISTGMNP